MKAVTQNDRDSVDVILLYHHKIIENIHSVD
jgi:hypothetical protein